MSIDTQEQVEREKMMSSREHAWYNMIRVRTWWNRTHVSQDVNVYNIIIIIKNLKSKVKSDESKYSKTSGTNPPYAFMT